LIAWKVPIGRPNCTRSFAYEDVVAVERQLSLRGDNDAGQVDLGQPSGRVEAVHRRHAQPGSVDDAPDDAVTGLRPQHDERGERPGDHGPRGAGQGESLCTFGRLERRRADRDARRDGAVGEPREQLFGERAALARNQGGGVGGRDESAGSDRAAQLLDDNRELEQTVAGAAVLLGHVQPEPAEVGRSLPVSGQLLRLGVHRRARRRRRAVAGEHLARGLPQRLMVLGDADRHVVRSLVN
jgi:hypothetical protein